MPRAGWLVLLALMVLTVSATACRKKGTGSAPPAAGDSTASKPPPPVIDERAQAVINEMISKWDQVQALSSKVATELPQAAGLEGMTKGDGVYDLLKRDGKLLVHFQLLNTMWFRKNDAEHLRAGEMLKFVHDGEALYFQLQQPQKMKKTTKSGYSSDRVLQIGGPDLFQGLTDKYNVTLAPEETVDGVATYVLEATPTAGAWKARHYFDKQTGVRVRHVEFDADGKQTFLLALSELNLRPEFSEGHFTYRLPEGYELIDETGKQP